MRRIDWTGGSHAVLVLLYVGVLSQGGWVALTGGMAVGTT